MLKKFLDLSCLIKHGFRKDFSFTDLDLDKCFEEINKNTNMIETDKKWIKKPSSFVIGVIISQYVKIIG